MFSIEFVALLLIGVAIGAFGVLVGAAGGFLTVPLLISGFVLEPRIAVGTSLLFMFSSTLSGSIAYSRQGRVDFRIGLLFATLTIPGSILGAHITGYFEPNLFKILFATILLLASIFPVVKPIEESVIPKLRNGYVRTLTDRYRKNWEYVVDLPRGLLFSLAIGFASSIFGIGGGLIYVPVMIFLLGFPTHISVATSRFIVTFITLAGFLSHASLGNVQYDFAIPMALGGVIGGQVGAMISRKTRGTIIQRLLGLTLILVAAKLILEIV
ncbi:MAG: sulfite exporter TauE/SafE family protein [archaeon]|nr:sulfite exporter TauE/SafE family protein [archaeon]